MPGDFRGIAVSITVLRIRGPTSSPATDKKSSKAAKAKVFLCGLMKGYIFFRTSKVEVFLIEESSIVSSKCI
jgi:hypothetical protein